MAQVAAGVRAAAVCENMCCWQQGSQLWVQLICASVRTWAVHLPPFTGCTVNTSTGCSFTPLKSSLMYLPTHGSGVGKRRHGFARCMHSQEQTHPQNSTDCPTPSPQPLFSHSKHKRVEQSQRLRHEDHM